MTYRVVVPDDQLSDQVRAYLEDDACTLIVRRPVKAGPDGRWSAGDGLTRKSAQHLRRQLSELGIRAEVEDEEAGAELEPGEVVATTTSADAGWELDEGDDLAVLFEEPEPEAEPEPDVLDEKGEELLSWFGDPDVDEEEERVEAPDTPGSAALLRAEVGVGLGLESAPAEVSSPPSSLSSPRAPDPPPDLEPLMSFSVQGGSVGSRRSPPEPEGGGVAGLIVVLLVLAGLGGFIYLVFFDEEAAVTSNVPPAPAVGVLPEVDVVDDDLRAASDARAPRELSPAERRAELQRRVREYYKRGLDACERRDYLTCRHQMEKVIKLDPSRKDAYSKLVEATNALNAAAIPKPLRDVQDGPSSEDARAAPRDTTPERDAATLVSPDGGPKVVVIEPDQDTLEAPEPDASEGPPIPRRLPGQQPGVAPTPP